MIVPIMHFIKKGFAQLLDYSVSPVSGDAMERLEGQEAIVSVASEAS